MKPKFFTSVEDFNLALFYYTFDTFYAEEHPRNDNYLLVRISNEDGRFVFLVEKSYFEEKADEYDLNVVWLKKCA